MVPHGAWPMLKELFRRFGKDQCPAYAAALSFFSILSIVPMLVVALAALAFLFQDPHQAMLRLQRLVGSILPGGMAFQKARDVLKQANVETSVTTLIQTRGIVGVVGLLSLIWASMQIFVNAAPAMNAAFEVEETRGWPKLRLLALGLLIGAGALFLLSLLPSSGPDFVRHLHIPWIGLPQRVPWYIDLLFALVALAINVTMFAVIYWFLPNAPNTWREAYVGGLVAGVLWEIAKRGFAYYLANFAHYDKVYGTLGGMIILVLWIYYTSMIMLLGAEATALSHDIREAAHAPAEQPARARPVPTPTRRRART
jgi:membrane protein